MSKTMGAFLAGLAAAVALASTAAAQDAPRIEGEIVIELQNDWTYDSDDEDNELNDTFTTTEADFNFFATNELYINTHLTLEAVEDPDPGEDRFFGDHGLFVETLNLNYETDAFFVLSGKFGPNFSIAFDAAPGIYGTDLAEDDIELAERIGFAGGLAFGDDGIALGDAGIGRHVLSASAFFTDTTFLSESIFENRGAVEEADGGPSNTNSLESYTIALDGSDFSGAEGLRYHLGFAKQEVDEVFDDDGVAVENTADEYRFAAAAEWGIGVTEDVTVTPLLEYVRFWNAEGLDAENRDYLTASTLLEYQNWNLALAYTGRFTENDDDEDRDDFQFQVSAGYSFDFGLTADIGWKFSDEEDVDTQIFGAFLTYSYAF